MTVPLRNPLPTSHLVGAFQAALLLLVLSLAVGWPRAGQAALLLPLAGSPPGEALVWLAANGATLVGPARGGGGVVVRLGDNNTAIAALQRGWLLIAVPETMCSPNNQTSNNQTTRRT
ncbi:hypothetical protein [Novosphingobium sp. Chol11]|uniref:hypothetical protein n=1 Tax=Novosphingobium sp. Chol11 TaxID=1385763 RepID=UPI0025F9A33C|nr:hypothetical protein [Novosphingobium sp. Chol11]